MVRAVGTFREAVGLPASGRSSTEADDPEAWAEVAGEDAVRTPPPCPRTPDTGKHGVMGCPQNLQHADSEGAMLVILSLD